MLSALRSAWVVLDSRDRVVRSSPSALPYGLIRGSRLRVDTLVLLARQVRRDGEVRELEVEVPRGHRGTELLVLDVRLAPLGDHVLLLAEDQTAVRRLDAVRRDFVANVSHELKTPVGALALLSEAVSGSADDPEAVRRFALRMQHESHRLTMMVQDLISLSRLQSNDPLREARSSSTSTTWSPRRSTPRTSRPRPARSGSRCAASTGCRSSVTRTSWPRRCATCSRTRSTTAPTTPASRSASTSTSDVVEISVADQGIGIPERDLERIFERFYRVDPARSRATGGTGLGLSIVKHVAVNHGGEVGVWSSEGAGSTFTLRLPAHRDEWRVLGRPRTPVTPTSDEETP